MQWTSAKKKTRFRQSDFFMNFFKTWKSYFLAVDPCRWPQDRHSQSCDVDSGTCDFRLDSSCLLYLWKFIFEAHAKSSLHNLVWTIKLYLQRWNKWYESSLKSCVTTHSKLRTGANDVPKWRQIWRFSKRVKNAFYPNRTFFAEFRLMIYRIRWENKKKNWLYGQFKVVLRPKK